jgi:hypothetical protein
VEENAVENNQPNENAEKAQQGKHIDAAGSITQEEEQL